MGRERNTIQPGRRLEIPDRVRKREEQFREPGFNLRKNFNEFMSNRRVEPANDNIDVNTFVGAVVTYAIYIAEDYAPGRGGASTDIIDMQEEENVLRYTVDTNAAFESQARFKSILTSGTGIASLWIDRFEVEDVKVTKKRPARDTYRYEIAVQVN